MRIWQRKVNGGDWETVAWTAIQSGDRIRFQDPDEDWSESAITVERTAAPDTPSGYGWSCQFV